MTNIFRRFDTNADEGLWVLKGSSWPTNLTYKYSYAPLSQHSVAPKKVLWQLTGHFSHLWLLFLCWPAKHKPSRQADITIKTSCRVWDLTAPSKVVCFTTSKMILLGVLWALRIPVDLDEGQESHSWPIGNIYIYIYIVASKIGSGFLFFSSSESRKEGNKTLFFKFRGCLSVETVSWFKALLWKEVNKMVKTGRAGTYLNWVICTSSTRQGVTPMEIKQEKDGSSVSGGGSKRFTRKSDPAFGISITALLSQYLLAVVAKKVEPAFVDLYLPQSSID